MIPLSVSIIIRTLNEARRLCNLLKSIENQDYKGEVETIVVDNQSRDETVSVAKKFGAKIVSLTRDKFSYPVSMNMGSRIAKNEILVFTIGHALPINTQWLLSGIKHFCNQDVGGVYSPVLPHKHPDYPKRTLTETILYFPHYAIAKAKGSYVQKSGSIGVFGATNCAVRKSLWEKHPFNEDFGLGGEDGEMARWIQDIGMKIVCDWRFAVHHSHGLGPIGMMKQLRYWQKLGRPMSFSREALSFRKDLDFS